jgi:hypothetical protein
MIKKHANVCNDERAMQALAAEALDSFWAVIVKRFPEAKTGDLSHRTTIQLDIAAVTAIREWVGNNMPAGDSK